MTMFRSIQIPVLHRYLLRQFVFSFLGCLFAFSSLFLVFDFFDRVRIFIREGSTVVQALSYLLFKLPLMVHLMTPIAVLLGVLMAVGRLSQLSEITAMRACGVSVFWIAKPLIGAGLVISVLMFLMGETIVPWSTEYVEQLYHVDIKKKVESGQFSRENFWYRADDKFYSISLYDSRSAALTDLSIFEMDPNFQVLRRIDAPEAEWVSPRIGWSMRDPVEIGFLKNGRIRMEKFRRLPLVIRERPSDFYNMQLSPESMSYTALGTYIEKLQDEGVPVTKYLVDRAAKISFPLVNVLVVILALPFALIPARSGTLTRSFVAGASVGFAYYVVHGVSLSLGSAELLPVIPAAWAANIVFLCIGTYLMAGAEY